MNFVGSAKTLLEHPERGVYQAHDLSAEVVRREAKERGGPHGAGGVDPSEITIT